jgi:hypothetical protein
MENDLKTVDPVITKAASPGVAAHIQRTTIRLEEYVPYHPTRESDPYYKFFNAARNRMEKLGLLKCRVCGTADNIEVHHSECEFSMAEGVDVSKFSALHPDLNIKSDNDFQLFVEGEHNLTPLCQTGDTPVIMADGSQKSISEIVIGDEVIGHDLQPHLVTATGNRHVSEWINIIRGYGVTDEHPFFISGSWSRAESLTDGVLMLEMGRLRSKQEQVSNHVIGLNFIEMMDSFLGGKPSTKMLLHDISMLHKPLAFATSPDIPTSVAALRSSDASYSLRLRSRDRIKGGQAAGIGTNNLMPILPSNERLIANRAHTLLGMNKLINALARAFAGLAASGIPVCDGCRSKELPFADSTDTLGESNSLPFKARWAPSGKISRIFHNGLVYHIGVSGSHSYFGAGVAVHNCREHHIGMHGIHTIPYPLWQLIGVWKEAYPDGPVKAIQGSDKV